MMTTNNKNNKENKKKSGKGKKIVSNNPCLYNRPCIYYPKCNRGDSCWYQHLEYESVIIKKKQEMCKKKQAYLRKATKPVNPNNKLLSNIYEKYQRNKNIEISSDNYVLHELAVRLSTIDTFKKLHIGKSSEFKPVKLNNNKQKKVTFHESAINIHSIGKSRIIDILSLIQHYNCDLDEITVDFWRYLDMHELSCGICDILLPFNTKK
eukprot:311295_1